jgi:rare lipoprotein A
MVNLGKKIIFAFLFFSLHLYSQENKVYVHQKATYYHNRFENRKTSNGEIFSQKKYTAAHKTIPLNTFVKITNEENGRFVIVKVNDRCPKANVIDMSLIAAKKILLHKTGVSNVTIELLQDDYQEIWEKQDDIFQMLDRTELNDKERSNYLDSIIFTHESKFEKTFLFTYYIRLTVVGGEEEAKNLINQLPEQLKFNAKAEKRDSENIYNINIGPFISAKKAIDVLDELKSQYSQAYIIKKKGV